MKRITLLLILMLTSIAFADLKIGFVDLKQVFKEYNKIKEMEQNINRQREKELAKLKGIEERIRQLKEEIPLYRPGSKKRQKLETELVDKTFEIKSRKDKANYFFAEKMRTGIEEIYREVAKEIEKYAKENNFFMIIKVSEADFFDAQAASSDAIKMEIKTRDVLYWNKKYDITKIVIQRMNKNFQSK